MKFVLIPLLLTLTITALISVYFLRYCQKLAKCIDVSLNVSLSPSYQPFVSIIIPTYNEASTIDDKLRNTLALNYPPVKVEIVVIDSASTDGTPDIAERFEGIKVIRQTERLGKSSALAEVFKVVTGEVVVITDADAMLDENVLNKALPYLADKSVGAVTGKQVLVSPDISISQKSEQSYRDFFDAVRTLESRLDSTMIFNGPFMAFKRDVLEAPPSDSVADDTEMALQVIRNGYRALYIHEAIFYENIPLSNKSRIKQKERRAQGLVQSFWRHRDLLFNKNYGKFGAEIFPAEFAVHLMLPFALLLSLISVVIFLYIDVFYTLIITAACFAAVAIYAASVYSKIYRTEAKKTNSILITFQSFMQLQLALLSGALRLVIFGTAHKWEQISDARRKMPSR